ncbi:GIY-YIG nuclease family protein [Marinomonas sp. THO17]|uniref:GIY-YIG nuclease family protein n=1 Tax=Marinomonas sp. THO17 TaxID=3149048 RepID=UPI00336C13F9
MTDSNQMKVMDKAESVWSLYIIKTRLNTLYTGISTDVGRRFKEHSGDSKKGARYLRGKGPLELVWQHRVDSKSQALMIENRIKKLNRQQKQNLIAGKIDPLSLLSEEQT